ncbi:hypothetical protein ACWDRR_19940 [Kitasatospora sp. NPDC003701]
MHDHTPTTGILSISLAEDATVRVKRHHAAEPEHENQQDWDWDWDWGHGNAWGGVLPMRQVYGPAVPDSHVKDKDADPPDSVQRVIGRTTWVPSFGSRQISRRRPPGVIRKRGSDLRVSSGITSRS